MRFELAKSQVSFVPFVAEILPIRNSGLTQNTSRPAACVRQNTKAAETNVCRSPNVSLTPERETLINLNIFDHDLALATNYYEIICPFGNILKQELAARRDSGTGFLSVRDQQ